MSFSKRKLTLKRRLNLGWIELSNPLPAGFVSMLCTGIKPTKHRYFEGSTKTWLVFWERLPELISFAKKYFGYIDYTALPIDWQMIITGVRLETESSPGDLHEDSPFSVLFLTDEAPMEVVKASYRVLASLYHPDHGGNADKMVKLNEAYDKICKSKKM